MNPETKQLLRNKILILLNASQPFTLPLETILQGLHIAGFWDLSPNLLLQHIAYLKEKNYIDYISAALSPGLTRYKLTSTALDYLEANNLA